MSVGKRGLPVVGTGVRAARRRAAREERARRRRIRRRRAAFVAMALLTAAGPVLVVVGYRTLLGSKAGQTIDLPDDPSEAGFQANVEPTPLMLVAQVDDERALVGTTVLILGSGRDTGGAVLFVPVATVARGTTTLVQAWTTGGAEGLLLAMGDLLGTSLDAVMVADPPRWTALTAPVTPLAFDNPDRLVVRDAGGATTGSFPLGPIELAADQVAVYLEAGDSDQTDLARLARHQLFWETWLGAVQASTDPEVVPGEKDAGLGRFVRALAFGPTELVQLPVAEGEDESSEELFTASEPAVAELIARLVPFPTAARPGARVRVRVLDGVGAQGIVLDVARVLVPAGAEIEIAGNAEEFGRPVTQVLYYDDAFADDAQRYRDLLAVGEVVGSDVIEDAVDVTVIVGQDFAGAATGG